MVIEAAKSIAGLEAVVRGYRLREVIIFNALVIPPEKECLEVQLYMQNQRNSATTSMSSIECRDFCLSSYADNEWRDVCSGTIATEYAERSSGLYDSRDDERRFRDSIRSRYTEIVENCLEKTTHERFYTMGRQMGYDFGPTFQTLQDISYEANGNFAAATIKLDEWMEKTGSGAVQEHVIHPTSLDGVLQTVAVLTNRGGSILGSLQAPTQFRELWVSHSLLSRKINATIQVAAKTDRVAIRDIDASIVALDTKTSDPVLMLDGYRATTVSIHHYVPSERRDIFYAMDWQPDIDLLSREEKVEHCLRKAVTRLVWNPSKRVVCLFYITQALRELDEEGYVSSQFHMQKYMGWMRLHVKELEGQNPLHDPKWQETLAPENIDQYLAKFVNEGPAERAIQKFCSQLTRVIKGEVDPLDLLFNQGLASDIYADEVFKVMGRRVAAFLDLVTYKHPNMNIVEIGAGTGSITESVLAVISQQERHATPKYNSYTFTDISPSFFEKAKDRFGHHSERMMFKTLDIERDPSDQGFEPGTYDLVLAAMVLHATATIKETLQNAKSLLKPGGYLVLVEPTNKASTVSDGVWGTLPGWWRGTEKDREWSPLYSQAEWELKLEEAGFSAVEFTMMDHDEAKHHTLTLLVSRAKPQEVKGIKDFSAMVVFDDTALQKRIAEKIATELHSVGASTCDLLSPDVLQSSSRKFEVCVSLLDLEVPFLGQMNTDNLSALKKIVKSSEQIYWLTSGSGSNAHLPEKAMASGFSRAMWEEQLGLRFANIDIDDPSDAAEAFRRIFERTFTLDEPEAFETDYELSGGLIRIPRVMEAHNLNNFVHSQTGRLEVEKVAVERESAEPLEVQFTFGQLDSFRFVRDTSTNQALAEDEVEVQVKATGINFMDMMVILGQIAGSYIGAEYSGVISRVGSAVKNFQPGDRVCSMVPGTFRTFARSKAYAVARIPDSLPFTEAFPAVYLTVIYGINHLGRLRKGESILIHAVAGAVGQCAIQLAKHIGADVFVTVSSNEKKKLIKDIFGISDDRIFYSRNVSFGRQIRQATMGRGVDVVLNSLSGEGLAESWRTLAPLGRFVEIGKRDIHTFQSLPMHPFSKNVSYHSVDLETLDRHNPSFMGQMVKEMEELLAARILSAPQPVSVFSRGDFESAIRYLQSGRHMGKAVIDWERETEIPVVPYPDPQYYFDPNASYVIAGGLGGIGRSVALWFASRGARNLILLSRSGPRTEAAKKLLEVLHKQGIRAVTPQCDVTSEASLRRVLSEAAESMPRVKGCIQGSMILKVSLKSQNQRVSLYMRRSLTISRIEC
jgi:NADPH:quinone reductase-like Zn-dependent oxidoreductase/SAM-dependent methyltransferase